MRDIVRPTPCNRPHQALGLMSGTSMDGIDAALVSVRGCGADTEVELRAFHTHPYEAALADELLAVSEGAARSALDFARLDFRVGLAFAQAALTTLEVAGVDAARIEFIGSHGQTLAHHAPAPGSDSDAATWQAGNASVIAAHTGIPVIADFRSADVALGGTGAPLVPYADYVLHADAHESRVLLNLGGIANLTWLPAGAPPEAVLGWDVGPGNMVLDALARALLGVPYDAEGRAAAAGRPDAACVEALLTGPFFERPAPKAAGREEFGASYAERLLQHARQHDLAPADALATAVELTARAVARAVATAPLGSDRVDAVYVGGGGRQNPTLMKRLRRLLAPIPVQGVEALGIDPDAKEAIDFAVLAHEAVHGRAANLVQVTGAQRPVILGQLALAGLSPGHAPRAHGAGEDAPGA